MITSIYQEVELSLTENLIPVTVPVKQYDNRARKVRCVLYQQGRSTPLLCEEPSCGYASMIVAMFDNAYEQAVRLANNNSISVQRMATVENQIKEMEERLQDAISHQVAALREAALEQNVELNEALSNGEVTINQRKTITTGRSTGREIIMRQSCPGKSIMRQIICGHPGVIQRKIAHCQS